MEIYSKTATLFACLMVVTGAAFSQTESTKRVNVIKDWNVFVENDPTQCWIVSSPTKTENTKNGRVVAVNRGDILLFVSNWPSESKRGEVSFASGYTFSKDEPVRLKINDENFEMLPGDENTSTEMAWVVSTEDDATVIDAMKRGAEVTVSGVSSRGTKTKDTFSLNGFTAALADAEKRCE